MNEDKDLVGPMACHHCGNRTIFKKEGEYIYFTEDEHFENEWAKYIWQLLRCLTCSKPTLVELYADDGGALFSKRPEDIEDEDYRWKELYPIALVQQYARDMPKDIIEVYKEASAIFSHSPRASAALLRLALQKLCIHLGQPGKNLHDDIRALVEAGLSPKVQQAFDIVRIAGNNAVHPGEIDFNDDAKTVKTLFKLINFIVEEMITRPREIKKMYDTLPQTKRDEIEKRDRSK
ncbi:DUF4145 domain-containing protein [Ktedonobacter robiniae]|uniref:DUF4145 domain-containing protein n=1 Tax=Ktedonobacter robiniae TaxID=2778365 RepID=A0ABQ3UM45_9CHLR|nr:DUF4145 domain-containing protein [Ktedonobacter robiniae]GHO53748.1 hypothetical protein KSB_22230 [Ktedonobacter robiniae]